MSYANETQAADGVVEKVRESSRVYCPECGGKHVRRVERKGFIQKHIYSWFGYFPWYCRECRAYSMLRKRNVSRSREKEYAQREG